jgi:Mg-chelatase subunit ChlD
MRQEIVLPTSGGVAGGAQLQERYGVNVAGGEASFGRGLAAGKPVQVTEWAMNRGTAAGFGVVNGPAVSTPVLGDTPVVGEAFGLKTETASAAPSAFGDFANDGDMIALVDAPAQRESVVMFDTGVGAPSGGATVAPAGEVALGRETTTFFAGAAVVPERPEVQVRSALRQQTHAEPEVVTRGLALARRSNVDVLDVASTDSEITDLKASLSARAREGAELKSVDKLARLDAFVEQAGVEESQERELSEARVAGRRSARDTRLGGALNLEWYAAPAPTAAPRPAPAAPAEGVPETVPAPVAPPADAEELAKRKDAAGGEVGELSLGFAPMKGQSVELEGRLMEEREALREESNEKVPALSVVERLGELEVGQQEAKQVALVDHYYAMVTNASVGFSSLGDGVVAGGAYGNRAVPMGAEVRPIASAAIEPVAVDEDLGRRPAPVPPSVPQPEVQVADNPFSTFSLNVADVSFKLAQASLEQGRLPDPGSIRSEEFINAFRYHDPAPVTGRRVGVTWERARYPFAHNRDLLRFGVQTAAQGREAGRPLNLVLCIDSSGSMKRADRVAILRSAMEVLAGQLRPEDRFSVVAFARTARLISSGLDGTRAEELVRVLAQLNPEGGTNLEDALRLAYESAHANYVAGGVNRVVLMTDGAANLGNVDGELLRQSVIRERKNGIALDSFGVGWEGYNDDLLETLSRNGDGRYGFLNSPEQVTVDFADQLAGALRVAASDVKVQMEFNARRVKSYRQIGYAKHQLTKEQFRDNTVDAAELGAAEAGQALYVVETDPAGVGPVGTLRVRFKVPGTDEVQEEEWMIPYEGQAVELASASSAMRLAATASACSEWLAESPYAVEVTAPRLLELLRGVPESFELEPRPRQLEWMIRQTGSIFGQ